jgi:glycerol uptake facilitator-like aquaporin
VTGPPPKPPWYRRDLLPAWMPVWLGVSLLIALGFGVIFGLFLDDEGSWRVGLVATGIGFGLALIILSAASARSPNTPEGQRLAPPEVIRKPVLVGIVTLWPYSWMTERRVSLSPAKSWKTIVQGTIAEVAGTVLVVLIVATLTWHVYEVRRRDGRWRASDLLALGVAVLMLGHGLFAIARRHA